MPGNEGGRGKKEGRQHPHRRKVESSKCGVQRRGALDLSLTPLAYVPLTPLLRRSKLHTCGTCKQPGDSDSKGELVPCRRCPLAYHRHCVPWALADPDATPRRVWLALLDEDGESRGPAGVCCRRGSVRCGCGPAGAPGGTSAPAPPAQPLPTCHCAASCGDWHAVVAGAAVQQGLPQPLETAPGLSGRAGWLVGHARRRAGGGHRGIPLPHVLPPPPGAPRQ